MPNIPLVETANEYPNDVDTIVAWARTRSNNTGTGILLIAAARLIVERTDPDQLGTQLVLDAARFKQYAQLWAEQTAKKAATQKARAKKEAA